MNLGSIYFNGVQRVAERATVLGIIIPVDLWGVGDIPFNEFETAKGRCLKTKFGSSILSCIEDPNIRYFFRLLESKNFFPDWHVIEYPDYCILDREDDLEGARSLPFLKDHLSTRAANQGIKLTQTISKHRELIYTLDNELVAKIYPVEFTDIPDDKVIHITHKFVQSLTTGTTQCDLIHACKRYFDDPQKLQPKFIFDENSCKGDYVVCTNLNRLSQSMRKAFHRLNIEISKGHAQELIAAFFNYESWNHIISVERTCNAAINPVVVTEYADTIPTRKFFREEVYALAYYRYKYRSGETLEVKLNSTYGSIDFRQPITRGGWNEPFRTDEEDNALRCKSLWQLDRYEMDETVLF